MPQLRNRVTGARERALSLSDPRTPEPSIEMDWDADSGGGARELLRGLPFDSKETEYLIARVVEGWTVRELPERLNCDLTEVRRLEKRVERKFAELRYKRSVEMSEKQQF